MDTSRIEFNLGENENDVLKTLEEIKSKNLINRIWDKDYTVWEDKPDEISNRMDWLDSPKEYAGKIDEINEFGELVKQDGFTNVLLLGMGGSSLAPEVFSLIFGGDKQFLNVSVLDSTDPEAILNYDRELDPEKTLYIVSTKSGSTVETLSYMKYFYNKALEKLGEDKVGGHFVAITDPGSGLEGLAKKLKFRMTFLNNPNIGGRYSALSYFGLVPAKLAGVDLSHLLKNAMSIAEESKINPEDLKSNTSAALGAAIGTLASLGKDKLTFILSKKIKPFGAWLEQLIAESTGKSGRGILPVVLELLESPEDYSNDRLIIYMKLHEDDSYDKRVKKLEESGYPVIRITLEDIYDLGIEFFRWEFATAVAGWKINIHPFNQPNVESAKKIAKERVKEYKEKGKLQELNPVFEKDGIKVYGNVEGETISDLLEHFFKNYEAGEDNYQGRSYITLQAYINPDKDYTELFDKIRTKLQKKYKSATTFGYGPRFLHSTGQLHKGDAGKGLFLQFRAENKNDADIPDKAGKPDEAGKEDSSITFGTLIHAQVLGDRQALLDNDRKVITIDLGNDIEAGLEKIYSAIG